MKQILLFGGSGFIGRHLVTSLAARGEYQITIADLNPPVNTMASNIQFQTCDIRKPIATQLSTKPDIIVNLAALCTEPGYAPDEYYATNTTGAGNVIDYCQAIDCKELWFTSSMSVYEYGESIKNEQVMPNPVTHYGKSKLAAEHLHLSWLEENSDHRLLIVRPAVIFGPGEHGNFTRLAKTLRSGYFAYPGRKDTIKANGHVEDLVDSILFMSERLERYQLFNFAYPHISTIETICRAICDIAGYRQPRLVIPPPFMYGVAKSFTLLNRFGIRTDIHPMRITKLISSTNIYPAALLEHGYEFKASLTTSLEKWFRSSPTGEFV